MKKGDYIVIAVSLLVVTGVALWYFASPKGSYAEIYSNGKLVKIVDLSISNVFTVTSQDGYNILEVKDGRIHVIESDCPHGDCIRQGYIDGKNETIVCLPHKMTVRILNDSASFDAVVY